MGYNFDRDEQLRYDVDQLKGEMSQVQPKFDDLDKMDDAISQDLDRLQTAVGTLIEYLCADENLDSHTKSIIQDIKL